MRNQAPGRQSANNERNKRAAFVDNSTTYTELTFDVVPPPNVKLFLERFGRFMSDKVITGVEFLPNLNGTNVINGYNVLRPLDFAQFTITLRDSKQNIILDNIPFVYFSNIGLLFKNKLFMLQNVDMRYSFITYSGLPLITPIPFIIPIIFTYH
jgi:hypothetical protein